MPARKGSTRVYVFCAGGAEGGRTPDLLIANEALSQLSYGPALSCGARQVESAARARGVVFQTGKNLQKVSLLVYR
jgi:hypothetical protein